VFRILLAQKTSLFRAALAAVLSYEDDLDVVAETARIEEVVSFARVVRPDVAVIDLDLLTDGNLEVAAQLNEVAPRCAILVLAGPTLPETVHEALDKYVHGFVGTDTAPGQLTDYLRRVAAGERVIDPMLAVAALSAPRNPLTARERDVLRSAGSGHSSAQIAGQLHLSVGTVRNYLSAIMHKTGARNRLEAFRIAEEAGWL
jgi:two-component system response regulator DesR